MIETLEALRADRALRLGHDEPFGLNRGDLELRARGRRGGRVGCVVAGSPPR